MRQLLPVLFLAGCAAQPDYAQPAARPSAVDFPLAMLAAHNAERVRVPVPALAWDPALALAAAGYARQLAATGTLRHSPRAARPGQGENLWMGTRGAYSPAQMV